MITTDHGSIRASKPIKIVGDRNTNTNLRYKLGKNLAYNAKEVFTIKEPHKAQLPAPNLSTSYVFAYGRRLLRLSEQLQLLCVLLQGHLPAWWHLDGGNAHSAHHADTEEEIRKESRES